MRHQSAADHGGRRVEFVALLGRGGFGSVYLADVHGRDRFVQRVAIKVLNEQVSDSTDIAARQRDEARLLARLNHDNIVKVFDLTQIHGRPAVIMEYVDGIDLSELLKLGALPVKAALQAIGQTASALDAVWLLPDPRTGKELNVVHRDIKPSNLLLSRHGGVKVLDFGIAKADFDREGETGSVLFGTTRYMAPETWLYRIVSNKVDTYALGISLIELLAGKSLERPPLGTLQFDDHMRAAISAVMPSDIHPAHREELTSICRSLVAFEPDLRMDAEQTHDRVMQLAESLSGDNLAKYAKRLLPPLLEERQAKQRAERPLGAVHIETPSYVDLQSGGSLRVPTPRPRQTPPLSPGTTRIVPSSRRPQQTDPQKTTRPVFEPIASPVAPQTGNTVAIQRTTTPTDLVQSPPAEKLPEPRAIPIWAYFGPIALLSASVAIAFFVFQNNAKPTLPPAEVHTDALEDLSPQALTTQAAAPLDEPPRHPEPLPDDPAPAPESNVDKPSSVALARTATNARSEAKPTEVREAPAKEPEAAPANDAPSPSPSKGEETGRQDAELPSRNEEQRSGTNTPPAQTRSASPKQAATPAEPTPSAPTLRVTLTSVPMGARVTVNGTPLTGTTPIHAELPRGSHSVVIRDGNNACQGTVNVSPLAARTWRCDLSSASLQAIQ